MKRTFDTLKYYLDTVVYVNRDGNQHSATLMGFGRNRQFAKIKWIVNDSKKLETIRVENVYPILKENGFGNEHDAYTCSPMHIHINLHKLFSRGYGARSSDDSPTGYIDIFNLPCVTPQQAEEGIEL